MHIELSSKQEADDLLGLLDIAVKAGGLNVASPALHFAQKIQTAVQADAMAKLAEPYTAPKEEACAT